MIPVNIDDMLPWGANVIRLQVYPLAYDALSFENSWPIVLADVVESVIIARDRGIKVVVDVHGKPFVGFTHEQTTWKNPDFMSNYITVWQDIATSLIPYQDAIYGYDLINEPSCDDLPGSPGVDILRYFHVQLITAIREIDQNVWIIYEPSVEIELWHENLQPFNDKRIIYSFHYYKPLKFTHQGVDESHPYGVIFPATIDAQWWDSDKINQWLDLVVNFKNKYNVPVLFGEFSVIRWADSQSAQYWYKALLDRLEIEGISWCHHAWREYSGWNLEYEGGYNDLHPAVSETPEAALIKSYFSRN